MGERSTQREGERVPQPAQRATWWDQELYMCGFHDGGDVSHQVCTMTETMSDSKVKLKTLVDVTCVFCVIATVYLVSILGTLRFFFFHFLGAEF